LLTWNFLFPFLLSFFPSYTDRISITPLIPFCSYFSCFRLLRAVRFILTFSTFSVPFCYISINSLSSTSICMLRLIPPRMNIAERQRWGQNGTSIAKSVLDSLYDKKRLW
jgi:hypothetical protein